MRMTPAASLQSDINVTPLVDVCLVLLIIFMVVLPTMVNGIPVHLPQAASGDALSKQPMQITLNSDKTLYVDSVVIRLDQLASELQRKHDQIQRPVVVRADKTLAYGEVIGVLDACRGAGFETVGLASERTTRSANARRAR
jgi:biopolymer transport protein ExbD